MATISGQVKTAEDQLKKSLTARFTSLEERFELLMAEMRATRDELTVYRRMVAQGGGPAIQAVVATPSRVEIPKPKAFGGSRNAKEIDNSIWCLEQYMKAQGVVEDAKKIETAALYLDDTAMVWWRRTYAETKIAPSTLLMILMSSRGNLIRRMRRNKLEQSFVDSRKKDR